MAELSAEPERIGSRRVLFAIAVLPEYGPALRRRVRPLLTGAGPVEAAVSLGVALARLEAAGRLPDLVVSLGSAGSRRLEQGRVYAVSEVGWRDVDASPIGFPKGRTPFEDHPVSIPLARPLPDMPAVRLSTGADIVSGAAYDAIDADMVDMETFALQRASTRFGVPLAGFRGVSDGREELRRYEDWTALLGRLDEALAAVVDRLAEALA